MNLDLIKKLTRLANNNPNEHEANLAARKVCQMLEEGNWSLANGHKTVQEKIHIKPDVTTNSPWVYKTQEDIFKDLFYNTPFSGSQQTKTKPKVDKRPLECTRCHNIVETGYIGNLYVCHNCQWKEYIGR